MFLSPLESEHMSPVCPVGNLSKSQPPGAAIVNIITQPPADMSSVLSTALSGNRVATFIYCLCSWYSLSIPSMSSSSFLSYYYHVSCGHSGKIYLPEFWFPLLSWKLELNANLVSWTYCILASRHLSVPCPAISPTRGIHSFLAICGDTELGDAINLAGLAWAGKSWMEEEENILKWPKIFSDCKR